MPKSITSRPASRRAAAAWFRPDERIGRLAGENGGDGHRATRREEPRQRLVRVHESVDLDALVPPVRVARGPGAEVDRVDPTRREVGDVRPRLLRLERQVAGVAQRAHERRVA